jgi:hypothetical protein
MTTIEITLPDQLAQEAQRAGLLTPAHLERWLQEQLKAQKQKTFFEAVDRMAAVNTPEMSPEEIAIEISVMRAERRRAA